jgi:hypothetical protein
MTEPALPEDVLDETLLAFCEVTVLDVLFDIALCA